MIPMASARRPLNRDIITTSFTAIITTMVVAPRMLPLAGIRIITMIHRPQAAGTMAGLMGAEDIMAVVGISAAAGITKASS